MCKEMKEAKDRYDAALMIIRDCTRPYYIKKPDSYCENEEYNGSSGEVDPFFESFYNLYPQKGFEGFIEENPQLFNNTSKKDLELASKRYKEIKYYFDPRILKIFTVPTIAATLLLLPRFIQFGHPVLFCVGCYCTIMAAIHVPIQRYYEAINQRVYYARERIRSDLGLTSEDIGKDTPKERSGEDN